MDGSTRLSRARKERRAGATVPSELKYDRLYTDQTRSYADCYRWQMTEDERRQWIAASLPVLGALRVFSCGLFVEARGHWWERASLPEGVLIYCTEGKGHYRQGTRQWEVQPGDLLYCPPRTHHRYWADKEQPWTIYWMHLSGERLADYERLLGLIERGPIRHIGIHEDIVASITRLILQQPSPLDVTGWFCIQANAIAILSRIAALPHNIADIAAAYGPIQKAIALMNSSLDQAFDMPRFACEAGCGRRHFIRQFRRVTGMTPGDWFIKKKIQRACALLTLPNIRVKDVASRLCYADELYFNRLFKRIVGIPPGKYRERAAHEHGLNERTSNA
jgi:AraC family transcriptional regulator, arabinose operon regulatory protein